MVEWQQRRPISSNPEHEAQNVLQNWNWNMLRNWRPDATRTLPQLSPGAFGRFRYYADVVTRNGSRTCAVAYATPEVVNYYQTFRGILCGTGDPGNLQKTLAGLLSDAYQPNPIPGNEKMVLRIESYQAVRSSFWFRPGR
jgi:hypothetical protein